MSDPRNTPPSDARTVVPGQAVTYHGGEPRLIKRAVRDDAQPLAGPRGRLVLTELDRRALIELRDHKMLNVHENDLIRRLLDAIGRGVLDRPLVFEAPDERERVDRSAIAVQLTKLDGHYSSSFAECAERAAQHLDVMAHKLKSREAQIETQAQEIRRLQRAVPPDVATPASRQANEAAQLADLKAIVLDLVQRNAVAIRAMLGLQAPGDVMAEVNAPRPGGPACSRCGARLFYSAQARGDGLCGPCSRKANGTQSPADIARERWGEAGEGRLLDPVFAQGMTSAIATPQAERVTRAACAERCALADRRDPGIGGTYAQRERADAVRVLRGLCQEFGDNDWPDNLHLGDVIEKHLGKHLWASDREATAQFEALKAALRDVPPGGASGSAPAWIIQLHGAACEVAGIEVRKSVGPDDAESTAPGRRPTDLRGRIVEVGPGGLCTCKHTGPCPLGMSEYDRRCTREELLSRGATIAERDAEWEAAQVDRAWRGETGREPGQAGLAAPDRPLRPGDTWRDPEGTEYVVVRAEEVGERPRWWLAASATCEMPYRLTARQALHCNERPSWAVLALVLHDDGPTREECLRKFDETHDAPQAPMPDPSGNPWVAPAAGALVDVEAFHDAAQQLRNEPISDAKVRDALGMPPRSEPDSAVNRILVQLQRAAADPPPPGAPALRRIYRSAELATIPPGLYELTWHVGGTALAAVGTSSNGERWFAPSNWRSSGVPCTKWEMVESAAEVRVPSGGGR